VKNKLIVRFVYILCIFFAYSHCSSAEEEISIEGEYWLESRVLTDGKVK